MRTKGRWLAERLARVVDAHVEKATVAEGIKENLLLLESAAPLIPHRYRDFEYGGLSHP